MHLAFPSGSAVKNPPAKTGDIGSISGLGRSPGEGNGNWLQYSYLKNPLDRGAWRATVHGVTKELGHNLATKQKQYTKHCQTHVLRSNCIYNFQKGSYNKLQWYSISISLLVLWHWHWHHIQKRLDSFMEVADEERPHFAHHHLCSSSEWSYLQFGGEQCTNLSAVIISPSLALVLVLLGHSGKVT